MFDIPKILKLSPKIVKGKGCIQLHVYNTINMNLNILNHAIKYYKFISLFKIGNFTGSAFL